VKGETMREKTDWREAPGHEQLMQKLVEALKSHGVDTDCDLPSSILAEFVVTCLELLCDMIEYFKSSKED
jgi:hypothetical protein